MRCATRLCDDKAGRIAVSKPSSTRSSRARADIETRNLPEPIERQHNPSALCELGAARRGEAAKTGISLAQLLLGLLALTAGE